MAQKLHASSRPVGLRFSGRGITEKNNSVFGDLQGAQPIQDVFAAIQDSQHNPVVTQFRDLGERPHLVPEERAPRLLVIDDVLKAEIELPEDEGRNLSNLTRPNQQDPPPTREIGRASCRERG